MSLASRIKDQLQSTPPEQAAEIRAFDDQVLLEVKLADYDRLGCLLYSLHLQSRRAGLLTFDPSKIEQQITYLGEKLQVIETERREGRTILRSNPPRRDGPAISYFEMVLDRFKELSLWRYRFDSQKGKRRAVPAALTRETLERLIGDLVRLAQG